MVSGSPLPEAPRLALESIAIVGGSLAGLRGAEALRRLGFEGRIAFVGAESHLPYDRPPLSKEVLRGDREPDRIALAKPEAFEALELELHLGRRAVSLDLGARAVALDDGELVPFDGLFVATGATPRSLPGAPPGPGVHVLRTLDDCLALRAELEKATRVVVVGAGFIGAEVAATCRQRGLEVTLVEALPAPLAASLPPAIGETLAAIHRDHGVDLRCGGPVAGLVGEERAEGVRLADGTVLPADVVVVGIGVVPETGWLASSGLHLDDGVVCDATCAASAPRVVAAGDVARWNHPLYGAPVRVEHWTNAVEQAEAAAATLLAAPGEARPYAAVPFVWSDQYDRKIQMAGDIRADDDVHVAHGSLSERRFVALFGRAGRLTGAVAMNRVRLLMGYRRLLREGIAFEEAVARSREGT